jgi:hypothetical protein
MLLKNVPAILWKFLLMVATVLVHSSVANAQHIITTVAGGGPNNIPALQAGIGQPTSVFKDSNGNLYFSALVTSSVYKIDGNGTLTRVAGIGGDGFSGDGGPATAAHLTLPSGVFVDQFGNIYIADSGNNRIRKVVASTGVIQTIVGTGTAGSGGDGGPALSAELSGPSGLFVDGKGNIFIADSQNNKIREVVAATGIIQTVAGNGVQGFSGDGGPATSAALNLQSISILACGLFVDGFGNVFFPDTANNRVRVVVAATGNIQTVAGNGTQGFGGDDGPATSAELALPTGVFVEGNGNMLIADSVNGRIREVFANTGGIIQTGGTINTVAGNGDGFSGDGGPATSAGLLLPLGVFVDGSGNIVIADSGDYRIREVAAATGNIQTVAGNGSPGFSGDGGPATSAGLLFPFGVFVDGSGNIFIVDSGNDRIREVVAATGDIQTVAGNGTPGFSGDGGPATSASLLSPFGVFVDVNGNIFIADSGNSRIREVVADTGNIQTVAGNGTAGFSGDGGPALQAELNLPLSVYVDAKGNIFLADSNGHRIREVVAATGNIQTVAGNGTPGFSGDGGSATSAELNTPGGVFVDGSGNIFVGDTGNARVREIIAATGIIQTVAGNGTLGFSGDGGPATSAQLSTPYGIFLDKTGNLFISDGGNSRVREVIAGTGNIRTVVGNGTFGFGGDGGPAIDAEIAFVPGIWGDPNGSLYLSDLNNARIRKVTGFVTGPPASITATGGTPQTTVILAAFPAPLAATVTDADGNPIAGATVTFVAPDTGASGTFANAADTAITNTAGLATSAVFTANGTLGSYTVTATTPGVSGSAAFNLTNTTSGNPATLVVLPQPSTVGLGATVQFFAQDASGSTVPVTWSVSPATGAGTISASGSYQAPTSGSTSQTVTLTATAIVDSTKLKTVSFTLAANGLGACCNLPQQLTAAPGKPGVTGVQLNGVSPSSTVPFMLSCMGLPTGAGCIFTLPNTSATTQVISGASPFAFCSVFVTGPGTSTTGMISRFPRRASPSPQPPLYSVVMLFLGVTALLLRIWKSNETGHSGGLAFLTVALVCISLGVLGACNGFSQSSVAPPSAQVTPSGTYQIQILATPPAGSGFVQSRLIVPLTVP